MFWKCAVGVVAGSAMSAVAHRDTAPSLAVDAPTLDIIMDPTQDIVPVRAVIIGGGYSGSRLAYQLDSVFNLTFIDEKNFFELHNDIIPVIANPWDEKAEEACRRMMVLHRYYLKRANVLTGSVDGVSEKQVHLRDGRNVPYDLLFVATGEKKPFPFSTTQRTVSGRVQELKHFNAFMQTCHKVAVVGGGPVGTSLAYDLASCRPDLDVHLFQSRPELVPALPRQCRLYALDKLETKPNLHVHLASRVTDIFGVEQSGKVIKGHMASNATTLTPSSSSSSSGKSGWFAWLPWAGGSAHGGAGRVLYEPQIPSGTPQQYKIAYDTMQYERVRPQSIINQLYFGVRDEVKLTGDVTGHNEDIFDYVFPVTGDTPRPIQAGPHQENVLQEHEVANGHYRVSTLMQFFGHPNRFALGRCTNFPVTRGYGASDIQSRTLFRELNSVLNNPSTLFLHSRDGLQLPRLKVPRLHVRLGVDDGVGCTPWSGGLTGVPAVHEFLQDRNYLVKELMKPVFYKQQDAMKVKQRISQWLESEITDVVDFTGC